MSSRGGGPNKIGGPKPKNLIIIFGCPPNKTVFANSSLTRTLFARLRKKVNLKTHCIKLPKAILDWEIPGDGELMLKSTSVLLLENVFPGLALTNPTEEVTTQTTIPIIEPVEKKK